MMTRLNGNSLLAMPAEPTARNASVSERQRTTRIVMPPAMTMRDRRPHDPDRAPGARRMVGENAFVHQQIGRDDPAEGAADEHPEADAQADDDAAADAEQAVGEADAHGGDDDGGAGDAERHVAGIPALRG